MQTRTGGRSSVLLAARAILMATALMGVGAGVAPPALAHEVTRNQVTAHHTAFNGRPPVIGSPTLEIAASHSVRDPIPFDTAILMLLCSEARAAVRTGKFSPQLLDWIVANADGCWDRRLLIETFGF